MWNLLNETVKKMCFNVDLYILKYIWHFQCSVDTRNRVKITKILEKSVPASRYYFSLTWPIYNRWLHSLAQQGSPHPVDHRQHSLLTTSHNPIFMKSSKDLWKWPCIISTSGDVLCVIRRSSLSAKITNWPKTTRKTEICKYQFYMNEDLYFDISCMNNHV